MLIITGPCTGLDKVVSVVVVSGGSLSWQEIIILSNCCKEAFLQDCSHSIENLQPHYSTLHNPCG